MRFCATGNPTVQFGAVFANRNYYGKVRCVTDIVNPSVRFGAVIYSFVRFREIRNPTVRFGAVLTNQKSSAAVRRPPPPLRPRVSTYLEHTNSRSSKTMRGVHVHETFSITWCVPKHRARPYLLIRQQQLPNRGFPTWAACDFYFLLFPGVAKHFARTSTYPVCILCK